jgi:hypothetical protein
MSQGPECFLLGKKVIAEENLQMLEDCLEVESEPGANQNITPIIPIIPITPRKVQNGQISVSRA